jgi:hypothetical protein
MKKAEFFLVDEVDGTQEELTFEQAKQLVTEQKGIEYWEQLELTLD